MYLNHIQIVYLGWFWKDWSIINNGLYSITNGLQVREDIAKNTGDLTGVFSLDEDWVTLNQMIKYYKYGFGRASDHVNEAIRANVISREEGIKLVEENPNISESEIRKGLEGNICRCTGYNNIVKSIAEASVVMGGK